MEKHYKKGEIVIRQGDHKDKFLYWVTKGKLSVQKVVNGNIIDCGYLREGDIFGEISLIIGTERAATVMASEDDVVVQQLDKKLFFDLIKRDPEIAWKVLTNLAIKTQMLDEIQGQISDPKMLRKLLLGRE
ncbi:MAG TPA: cyclic nucleotide-binding domain-containing protein [Spirochaetota bacterium]|nr:cyclic nucleotide-binding domain-containing protein [Spirochaetota bacterium]